MTLFRQTIDDLTEVLDSLDPDQFLLIRTGEGSDWHVNTLTAAKRRGYVVHKIGDHFYRVHGLQYQLPFYDQDDDGMFDAQLISQLGSGQ